MLSQNFILGVLIAAIAIFIGIMTTLVYCIAIHLEEAIVDDFEILEQDQNEQSKHDEIPEEL